MFTIGFNCKVGSLCKDKLSCLFTEKEKEKGLDHELNEIEEGNKTDKIHEETDEEPNRCPFSKESTPSNTSISSSFRLPIQYLEKKEIHTISPNILEDLELCTPRSAYSSNPTKNAETDIDTDTTVKSMYDILFQPSNPFGKKMKTEWAKQFTSNTDYLKDSQKVIENMKDYPSNVTYNPDHKKMMSIWRSLKEDSSFLDKYGYMEWSMLKSFNTSTTFLQTMSVINTINPLTSILIPLIILLVPFVILKIRGISVTFQVYFDVLKNIARNHFIGKAIHSIENLSFSNFGYLFMMVGLYFLQIYQNITSFIHFYKNIKKINEELTELKSFIQYSIDNMKWFIEQNKKIPSYHAFIGDVENKKMVLEMMKEELSDITEFQHSFYKYAQIGNMLKCYYSFYSIEEYGDALQYSFDFEGFLDNMKGIYKHVDKGILHSSEFYSDDNLTEEDNESDNDIENNTHDECNEKNKKNKKVNSKYLKDSKDKKNKKDNKKKNNPQNKDIQKTCILQQFYPPHMLTEDNYIKNDCDLEKNMIITGVNASGKTTTIKTTALNILFTQQFGVGFYQSCLMKPYTHLHSYLNIPDTSGRDSLFQAESRRCKEIIDIIQNSTSVDRISTKPSRHFCIFDELYSGTNPEEATKTAYSFLWYISQFSNVDVILTSHYTSICKRIKKTDRIDNYEMVVEQNPDGGFHFTYRLRKGICIIQGAIEILKSMQYPKEIIDCIENYET